METLRNEVTFKTEDVDLAAYLVTHDYVVTSVEVNARGSHGVFVFMDSPGIQERADRWRFGEKEWREFSENRLRMYRWARTVVDRARDER